MTDWKKSGKGTSSTKSLKCKPKTEKKRKKMRNNKSVVMRVVRKKVRKRMTRPTEI